MLRGGRGVDNWMRGGEGGGVFRREGGVQKRHLPVN